MKFLDRFKKHKEPDFFELLTKQAEFINKGVRLLNEYCITHDESVADAVVKAEDEGDMVRRVLVDDMNRTFITPFDREDLFKLSAKLDEVLDYAKTSVDEIRLFKVTPNEEMIEITTALNEMSEHIILAVSNIKRHEAIARDEAIYVKRMENKVGHLPIRPLEKLFITAIFR